MKNDYIPVNIEKIPVGLKLDCKVYIEKSGEYSFLCENTTVTESLLTRFRNAADPGDSVYITAQYMEAFLKQGIDLGWEPPKAEEESLPKAEAKPPPKKKTVPPPPSTAHIEAKKQYEESKVKTKEMFAGIAESKKVNVEETEDFVHEIGRKLENNDVSAILQSINGLRKVDEYLHTHSLNVAFLNGLMARWLKYDKAGHAELVKTGLLHDIGKLFISPDILNKPGRLTPEEFAQVKKHSTLSFEMLVNSGIREKALLLGVMQHHEKLNGSGYPHGLASDEICEYARITSISDIYDAMVAKRVYKEAQSPFVILANFAEEGYSMLDINLVKLFIDNMINELKGKYVLLSDDTVGKVVMINERNLIYPMVEVDGEIIQTTPELYCVSMYNANISLEEVEEMYK